MTPGAKPTGRDDLAEISLDDGKSNNTTTLQEQWEEYCYTYPEAVHQEAISELNTLFSIADNKAVFQEFFDAQTNKSPSENPASFATPSTLLEAMKTEIVERWFERLRDGWLAELENSTNKNEDFARILKLCSFFTRRLELLPFLRSYTAFQGNLTVENFEEALKKHFSVLETGIELLALKRATSVENFAALTKSRKSESSVETKNTVGDNRGTFFVANNRDSIIVDSNFAASVAKPTVGLGDIGDAVNAGKSTKELLEAYNNNLDVIYEKRVAFFERTSGNQITGKIARYFKFLEQWRSNENIENVLKQNRLIYSQDLYQYLKLHHEFYFAQSKEKQDEILGYIFVIPVNERHIFTQNSDRRPILTFLGQMLFRQREKALPVEKDKRREIISYVLDNVSELSSSDIASFLDWNEEAFFEYFQNLPLTSAETAKQADADFSSENTTALLRLTEQIKLLRSLSTDKLVLTGEFKKDFQTIKDVFSVLSIFLNRIASDEQLKVEVLKEFSKCFEFIFSQWAENPNEKSAIKDAIGKLLKLDFLSLNYNLLQEIRVEFICVIHRYYDILPREKKKNVMRDLVANSDCLKIMNGENAESNIKNDDMDTARSRSNSEPLDLLNNIIDIRESTFIDFLKLLKQCKEACTVQCPSGITKFEQSFRVFLVDFQQNKVSDNQLKLILELPNLLKVDFLKIINDHFNAIKNDEKLRASEKESLCNSLLGKISQNATFYSVLLCVAANTQKPTFRTVEDQYPFLVELRNYNRSTAPIRQLMEAIIVRCPDAKNSVLDVLVDYSATREEGKKSKSRETVERKQAELSAQGHTGEAFPNPFDVVQPKWFCKITGLKSVSPEVSPRTSEGSPTRLSSWLRKPHSGSVLSSPSRTAFAVGKPPEGVRIELK